MKTGSHTYERFWGSGLILLGIGLLGVVFVTAFAIVREPGEYYDEWVPDEQMVGPEASFEWRSTGLLVEFTDASETGDAELQRWVWDFGDGAGSSEHSPSHLFAEPGEFDVTLEVVDATGMSSKAEGTVEIEASVANHGDGAIGLSDIADTVVDSVDRAAKGVVVVLLVLGLFVVLTMVGGRLLRHGVRTVRPGPDRISVKLRPRQLELAMAEAAPDARDMAGVVSTPTLPPLDHEPVDADEPAEARVRS